MSQTELPPCNCPEGECRHLAEDNRFGLTISGGVGRCRVQREKDRDFLKTFLAQRNLQEK